MEIAGPLMRYWWHVAPLARRELAHWRARATLIENPELREIAIGKLQREGANVESAAFFALLAPDWQAAVRRIVAFQVVYEYLDGASEREPHRSLRLHSALIEAVGGNSERQKGAYLKELVDTCRSLTTPSAEMTSAVRDIGVAQTRNHGQGDMQAWAEQFAPGLPWWEAAAAGISSLGVLAMLCTPVDQHSRIRRAYLEICALSALLDGLVDLDTDAPANHNWVSHYGSVEEMTDRLRVLAGDAQRSIRGLPQEHLHQLLLAGLIAHNLVFDLPPGVKPRLSGAVRLVRPAVVMLRAKRVVLPG